MLRGVLHYIGRHHLALLALFFGLAGTAFAATNRMLPPNSVGTRQVIDHSLLSRDFRKGQLPHGPQGPQGPAGTPGASATKLWAVVGSNGKLARASGVTSASRYGGHTSPRSAKRARALAPATGRLRRSRTRAPRIASTSRPTAARASPRITRFTSLSSANRGPRSGRAAPRRPSPPCVNLLRRSLFLESHARLEGLWDIEAPVRPGHVEGRTRGRACGRQ